MPLVHIWKVEGSVYQWRKKTVLSFYESIRALCCSGQYRDKAMKPGMPQRGVKAAGDGGDLHKGLTAETKGDTQLVNLLWDR